MQTGVAMQRHGEAKVFVFRLCGGPVSWVSKNKAVVALSTTEAEYIMASVATQELIWLRKLFE